jgi:hypothetical protein
LHFGPAFDHDTNCKNSSDFVLEMLHITVSQNGIANNSINSRPREVIENMFRPDKEEYMMKIVG